MAGLSQQSYSSPSSSQAHRPFAKTDPTPLGCEICGAPRAGFWLIARRHGQVVASISRACPSCVEEADEPSENTTGASGLRASDDANQAATTTSSTAAPAPAARINFLSPRGAPPLEWRSLLDGRALSSLPDPFKTLLHGVYSNATDWVLGVVQSIAGRRDGRRL